MPLVAILWQYFYCNCCLAIPLVAKILVAKILVAKILVAKILSFQVIPGHAPGGKPQNCRRHFAQHDGAVKLVSSAANQPNSLSPI